MKTIVVFIKAILTPIMSLSGVLHPQHPREDQILCRSTQARVNEAQACDSETTDHIHEPTDLVQMSKAVLQEWRINGERSI